VEGKNPIYFGVITIIPFDNLYRQVYFVMHTFLVLLAIVLSVLLIFTDSDYPLGIFKLFLSWKSEKSLWCGVNLSNIKSLSHTYVVPNSQEPHTLIYIIHIPITIYLLNYMHNIQI
jgi:hypothetical protein